VVWNDATNSNYREQFIKILNGANFGTTIWKTIRFLKHWWHKNRGIHDEFIPIPILPIFKFSKAVSGVTRNFEIVPAEAYKDSESIYESGTDIGRRIYTIYIEQTDPEIPVQQHWIFCLIQAGKFDQH
jgi:hypothetical protein